MEIKDDHSRRGNKGGSSKTTTATNLAVAPAIVHSKDVLLLDSDIQRSASCWHTEREASGLSPAITLIEKRAISLNVT